MLQRLSNMMLVGFIIYWTIGSLVHGLPGKGYRNSGEVTKAGIQTEPTCDELKAMWRFSKRQSRAAELTNELPMYPDPFADNVWQPFYATSRSIVGKPVYGRVKWLPNMGTKIVSKDLMNFLGHVQSSQQPRSRPASQFRLSGGRHLFSYAPQTGSFNHLKELIKTERARELQQQRLAEESTARAAALKEIGRNQPGRYTTDHFSYDMGEPQETMFAADMPDDDETQDDERTISRGGILTFPDLLAPGAKMGHEGQVARFVSDYSPYTRNGGIRVRSRSPSLFDPNMFRGGFTGYVL